MQCEGYGNVEVVWVVCCVWCCVVFVGRAYVVDRQRDCLVGMWCGVLHLCVEFVEVVVEVVWVVVDVEFVCRVVECEHVLGDAVFVVADGRVEVRVVLDVCGACVVC